MSENQNNNVPFPNIAPKKKAIAGLVLGIVAIVLCLIPLICLFSPGVVRAIGIIGIIIGAIGVVLEVMATKAGYKSGLFFGGLAASIVGIVVGGYLLIFADRIVLEMAVNKAWSDAAVELRKQLK